MPQQVRSDQAENCRVDLPEEFERGLNRVGDLERAEHHVGSYIAFGLAAVCAVAAAFDAVTGLIDGDFDPEGVVAAALGAIAFAAVGGFSRFMTSLIGPRDSEKVRRMGDDGPDSE
jgi:hypothetical protein